MDLGLKTQTFGVDDQSWLGSEHGTQATESITLDTSTFAKGTHYPDGYFKSGIPLGRITAGGKFGPYDNAAADGREVLAGFLFSAVSAPTDPAVDVGAALFVHGKVRAARLPVAVDAAGQADVAGRIRFI